MENIKKLTVPSKEMTTDLKQFLENFKERESLNFFCIEEQVTKYSSNTYLENKVYAEDTRNPSLFLLVKLCAYLSSFQSSTNKYLDTVSLIENQVEKHKRIVVSLVLTSQIV